MRKPIALQLYTLREAAAKDLPEVLRRVADIGYVGVEFAGLYGWKAADVARLLKEAGLQACSAHVPLPTEQNIRQLAEEASVLGYRRVISGVGADALKTSAAVAQAIEKIVQAAEWARSAGLEFGIHNHWWEFDHRVDGQTPFEILMTRIPSLLSELDVYWCAKAGADVPTVLRRWASRIPLLHIKDGDLSDGQSHKPVGKGRVAMRPIVEAADPQVLEWLIVELDFFAGNMWDAVRESYRYLVEETGLAGGRLSK